MESHDAIINDLKNCMNSKPDNSLKNRVLKSATTESSAVYIPRRRKKIARTLLIAAIIAGLTITTALATPLPGFIGSYIAGMLTVNEYEAGHLPNVDPSDTNRVGVITIDGVIIDFFAGDRSELPEMESPRAAQEMYGIPVLVPTYLENNEVACFVKIDEHNAGISIATYYADAYPYFCDVYKVDTFRFNTPGFFILSQLYVGEQDMVLDVIGEASKYSINGYDAIWTGGANGGLNWIQDGFFVQLYVLDISKEYAISIAESLEFLK